MRIEDRRAAQEISKRLEAIRKVGLIAGQKLRDYTAKVSSESEKSIKVIREFKASFFVIK